jgi:hypothetical protein
MFLRVADRLSKAKQSHAKAQRRQDAALNAAARVSLQDECEANFRLDHC